MNKIILSNEISISDNSQSMDKINILIPKESISITKENISKFMDEVSEHRRVFDYTISTNINDTSLVEVSLDLLFDTNYIHTVYMDLECEMQVNSTILERLSSKKNIPTITRNIYDNRIDDLTHRNDELTKQQKVIKMQLFNAISKRNIILDKITNYLKDSIENCTITYICNTTEIEKSFIDMDGLLNTVHEIK